MFNLSLGKQFTLRILLCHFALILFTILCLFSGCHATSDKPNKNIKTILVNSLRSPCKDVATSNCLQIMEKDIDNTWKNFNGDISGFEYAPGFIYTLQVQSKTKVLNEGSATTLNLMSIISKLKDQKLVLNDIWILQSINGKIIDQKTMNRPYLEFHLRTKTFLGSDGCNTLKGDIKLFKKNQIELNNIVSTDMACSNSDLQIQFLKCLGDLKYYDIDNGTLTFFNDKVQLMTMRKTD